MNATGPAPDPKESRKRKRRLLLLLLLMLLFCGGFWWLAQNLPTIGTEDPNAETAAGHDQVEAPDYLPTPSADGDRGNSYDGPVYHDPVPPRISGRPPVPEPVRIVRTVGTEPGTVGNATAPNSVRLRTMPPEIPLGMRYPGRVTPSKQIPAGTREVDWTFSFDGEVHHVHTTIAIDDGSGLRRPAHVSTYDDQGNLLVQYDGNAYLDKDGIAEVDGRNSTITGPMADQWSPDSFAIDQYGYMHSLDDQLQTGSGWKTGGPSSK